MPYRREAPPVSILPGKDVEPLAEHGIDTPSLVVPAGQTSRFRVHGSACEPLAAASFRLPVSRGVQEVACTLG